MHITESAERREGKDIEREKKRALNQLILFYQKEHEKGEQNAEWREINKNRVHNGVAR